MFVGYQSVTGLLRCNLFFAEQYKVHIDQNYTRYFFKEYLLLYTFYRGGWNFLKTICILLDVPFIDSNQTW